MITASASQRKHKRFHTTYLLQVTQLASRSFIPPRIKKAAKSLAAFLLVL